MLKPLEKIALGIGALVTTLGSAGCEVLNQGPNPAALSTVLGLSMQTVQDNPTANIVGRGLTEYGAAQAGRSDTNINISGLGGQPPQKRLPQRLPIAANNRLNGITLGHYVDINNNGHWDTESESAELTDPRHFTTNQNIITLIDKRVYGGKEIAIRVRDLRGYDVAQTPYFKIQEYNSEEEAFFKTNGLRASEMFDATGNWRTDPDIDCSMEVFLRGDPKAVETKYFKITFVNPWKVTAGK